MYCLPIIDTWVEFTYCESSCIGTNDQVVSRCTRHSEGDKRSDVREEVRVADADESPVLIGSKQLQTVASVDDQLLALRRGEVPVDRRLDGGGPLQVQREQVHPARLEGHGSLRSLPHR